MAKQIITLTKENLNQYPPKCFLNPEHEGNIAKYKWLEKRLEEGLTIKQLFEDNKCIGFIEYTKGEFAWRAVDAKEYMFIHCIWISPNKFKNKGNGSVLINEAVSDAKKNNLAGVAVITSDGPFMANSDIFRKNRFKLVESKGKQHLLVYLLKKAKLPKIKNNDEKLKKIKGTTILYTN